MCPPPNPPPMWPPPNPPPPMCPPPPNPPPPWPPPPPPPCPSACPGRLRTTVAMNAKLIDRMRLSMMLSPLFERISRCPGAWNVHLELYPESMCFSRNFDIFEKYSAAAARGHSDCFPSACSRSRENLSARVFRGRDRILHRPAAMAVPGDVTRQTQQKHKRQPQITARFA